VLPEQALAMAIELHRVGKLDAAEKLYEGVLAALPENPDALHFKGVLLHQRGRSEQALELIGASIALNNGIPDWHYNLGNVLVETGQLDAAADAYARAAALAPERSNIQHNIGVVRRHQQRPADAEAAFRRSLELDPTNPNTHIVLGGLLHNLGRFEEALRHFSEAVLLDPRHATSRYSIARAFYAVGRVEEAAQVYRDWLKEEPDNVLARHHLAACTGEGVPARAADEYVESVFDGFADSFDAKLAWLQYHAPQLVAAMVAELYGEPRATLTVLDAGCGTGLCGPLLAPYSRRLLGVDLSARMLAKAEPRQVYDELTKGELTAFIEGAAPASYDLIVSADTLCYFGDLGAVTRAAGRALRPDGWLIFTVEAHLGDSAGDAGFHLNAHGRYSHREDYLRTVLSNAGLVVRELRPAHLRAEGGLPVDGFVVAAQSAERPS
jgi:predicted TPR repeat methyltransferase